MFDSAKWECEFFPRRAVSAAYYSVFHSVNALFLFCKLVPKHKRGHRSVVSLFNDNFAHPGLFPMEIKTFLGRLEAMRNTGDYDPDPRKKLTAEDAQEAIAMAEKVNNAIRQYIGEHGGIENHA
ncbi:MAG: HEPN domain-containing protein [Synergistaceae bacterium]|nr:HEPN domain-containing protein [Synergistaceae bacterium]